MDVIQTQLFSGFSSENYNKEVLYDVELISRDLQNHFYTKRGERVMNPEFGTIIWDMVFEPYSDYVQSVVREDVIRVIESEPRVDLRELTVSNFDHGIIIEATIYYVPFQALGNFSFAFDQRAISNGVTQ